MPALDHDFAESIYFYDPNGIQGELICKTADYGSIMEAAGQAAHQSIEGWSEKTRAKKEALFGADSLARRGRPG